MAEQTAPFALRGAPATIALAGLAALAVAMGIGRFAFTPILPMMREDTGLSLAEGGWLAAANYAGYLIGALWAAVAPMRAAVAIRAALATIGVVTLAMSVVSGMAGWMTLRFVAGVASAWVLIHVSAWCLEQLASVRRPFLEAMVFSGVGIGIAVAGLLCWALTYARAGSADAWIHLGLISLTATAIVWNAFQPSAGAPRAFPARGRMDGRLVFAYGALGFGYIIPATFSPGLAKDLIGDAVAFGWAWPVFGAAAALSTFAMKLASTFSARALWSAAQLVMAFGVGAPALWPGGAGIALAALGVGGTFMVVTMAGMQEARRVAPAHATGLMASMTAAFAAGQIAGPIVVSMTLALGAGLSGALLIASAVLVAGVCALWTA